MLCAIAVPAVLAQVTTSPYSMYGYGLLRDNATSTQRQMGGIGYAMSGGRQINSMNPASYASIDSLTFLWDIGADVSMNWRSENDPDGSVNKGRGVGGGLDYLTMQFPISKHLGASIGLVPFSSVGYSFGDEVVHGSLSNQGTGGINQAYAGFAGRYKGLSLGFNISYDFGNVINDVYAYTSAGNQTLFEHVMQVRDWNVTIGAQYALPTGKYSKLILGATYTPKKTLRGKTWAAFWDITAESKADTVGYSNVSGKYYRPNAVGVGLSWQRTHANHVMVEADFSWQQWSKAKYSTLYDSDGGIVVNGQQFNDRMRVAVGAECVPRLRGNYIKRITYRVGAHWTRDYLKVGDNSVKEYGVSCGFGLPTPEGKTVINLGFEWYRRQASPVKLIKEDYFNITLGLNFNELWFWQRKIK